MVAPLPGDFLTKIFTGIFMHIYNAGNLKFGVHTKIHCPRLQNVYSNHRRIFIFITGVVPEILGG
jgi:hypothetical protein